jgi:hypothetical protein
MMPRVVTRVYQRQCSISDILPGRGALQATTVPPATSVGPIITSVRVFLCAGGRPVPVSAWSACLGDAC